GRRVTEPPLDEQARRQRDQDGAQTPAAGAVAQDGKGREPRTQDGEEQQPGGRTVRVAGPVVAGQEATGRDRLEEDAPQGDRGERGPPAPDAAPGRRPGVGSGRGGHAPHLTAVSRWGWDASIIEEPSCRG